MNRDITWNLFLYHNILTYILILFETGFIMLFCIIIRSKIIESSFQMPHPRAKVRTQMPLPWDALDKQMPRGGPGGDGHAWI